MSCKVTKILHNIVPPHLKKAAMKSYIELCILCPSEEMTEICIAFLADYPFESFDTEPTPTGVELRAYILAEEWRSCRNEALNVVESYGTVVSEQRKEDENWNARWEQESFQPVDIEGRILIRAPHHLPPTADDTIDVIVAPRMSFGSGHHATTRNMSLGILSTKGIRTVLDVGCGTGVLSILALKCGAHSVDAVDIDPWSVESTKEAAVLNGVDGRLNVMLGTVELIAGRKYDMVVANINRNIIINDIGSYVEALNEGGTLLVSGFFADDRAAILEAANSHHLILIDERCDNEWLCMKFQLR